MSQLHWRGQGSWINTWYNLSVFTPQDLSSYLCIDKDWLLGDKQNKKGSRINSQ